MAAQYVVVALKVENIHSGWLSSGKLVAPKEDNIQAVTFSESTCEIPYFSISARLCPAYAHAVCPF